MPPPTTEPIAAKPEVIPAALRPATLPAAETAPRAAALPATVPLTIPVPAAKTSSGFMFLFPTFAKVIELNFVDY
jgi:hypothetical protein